LPALLGALVVLSAATVWIARYWPEQGTWVPVYSNGVLLAAACLPATLLRGDTAFRVSTAAAVTTFGAWVAGGQVYVLATGFHWTDAADAVASLLSALVMVAAADLTLLAAGRRTDPRGDGGTARVRRRPAGSAGRA
jgi:hypothetical protein